MKFVLTVFVLLFFKKSISQSNNIENNDSDSLKKYSYFISGVYLDKYIRDDKSIFIRPITFGGTVFFIKKIDSLFLVTAKHVLTGCQNGVRPKKYPDKMNVKISDELPLMEINIASIKETYSCLPMFQDTDVAVIPIENKWSFFVNSVENFIAPPFTDLGSMTIFGYPLIKNSQLPKNPSNLYFKREDYVFQLDRDEVTGKSDLVSFHILSDSLPNENNLHGYSGSPVFFSRKNFK